MAAEKTLTDAFHETLKDVYYAEKASVRALKKSAKLAKLPELKEAFETHAEESAGQIERLVQVFEMLGKPARAKTCEAMQGLSAEMEEDVEDFGSTEVADDVLIGCAQAIEHYEIARYGVLKTWAKKLGMSQAEELLDVTLQEEEKTDALLNQIAEQTEASQQTSGGGSSKAKSTAACGSPDPRRRHQAARRPLVRRARPRRPTPRRTRLPHRGRHLPGYDDCAAPRSRCSWWRVASTTWIAPPWRWRTR